MRSFIYYSLLRLALLIGCVAVFWLLFGRSIIGAIAGVVISALLSYLILGKWRRNSGEAVERWLHNRAERKAATRRSQAMHSDEAVEDGLITAEGEEQNTPAEDSSQNKPTRTEE